MNLVDYQRALSRFSKFPDSREAKEFMIQCSKAMNDA
jgi:hypothetical protein